MPRYVLGISALYHDAAAALLCDGEVVAAVAEERLSRVRHDAELPVRAAAACLERAGIGPGDLELLVFYEKPLVRFERVLWTQLQGFPRSLPAWLRAMPDWLTRRLWTRGELVRTFGVPADRVRFCEHHLSHAASAFYGSGAEEAAVLTVDGVGEWATVGMFRGGPGGLEPLAEVRFPDSLGLAWSAFTAWAGFPVNGGEARLMGLAAYGRPRQVEAVRAMLPALDDGSFRVDRSMASWHRGFALREGAAVPFTERFVEVFGPPRHPDAPLEPDAPEGCHHADVAASLQQVTEERLLQLAGALHARTGLEDLCYAGGVALNSVANRTLALHSPFARTWVHPACGDDGGALGAAWWAWVELLGGPRPSPLLRADLGPAWSDEAVGALLSDLGLEAEHLGGELAERAAEDLVAGAVIGWFQGGAEWGPRALGHRSMLADPRQRATRERINRHIKRREPWRPLAPAVTAEAASRYADLPAGAEQPLRFMLCVVDLLPSARELLGATVHEDGSARLQVVHREQSPHLHDLLEAFGARTGHPVLLNTSLNGPGEPIAASPLDALATAARCGLDLLFLGGYRVDCGQLPGRNARA